MVYFICNNCGESLKKAQVDQHLGKNGYSRCKNCSVSCMDCHRDFDANSYVHHTKCITEQEKYSGGNFQMKASTVNKQDKRNKWLDMIRTVASRKDPGRQHAVQNVLNFLAEKETVPNKEKAFKNFMNAAPGNLKNQQTAYTVWMLLDKERQLDIATEPEVVSNGSKVVSNGSTEQNGKKEEVVQPKTPAKAQDPEIWAKAIKKLSKSEDPNAAAFKILSQQTNVPTGPRKNFKAFVKNFLPGNLETNQMWVAVNAQANLLADKKNGALKRKCAETENGADSVEPKKAKPEPKEEPRLPWKKTVLQVLSSSKNNSLPMKKLKKKVRAAFETSGLVSDDTTLTDEFFDVKLSKAISKIPNVVKMNDSKDKIALLAGSGE